MAKKKTSKANKRVSAKQKDNKNASTETMASKQSSEAASFLRNLGPEGYIKAADSLSKDVNINNYSMSTPDGATLLLESVSLKLTAGKRYGLVGKNGYGKTTLLNNMATYQIEGFPTHIRMVHVMQEHDKDDDRKVKDAVLDADVVRTQLLQEAERLEEEIYTLEDEEDVQKAQNSLDMISSYMEDMHLRDAPSRAFKILSGLGFSRKMQSDRVSSLSGGWRMRLEIAKALFVEPDLLLLDEPTNHLDFPAVLWLQEHLANEFKKTLVVVSHDKMFLNEVITNVIHLDNEKKKLEYYKGNYTAFEAARHERRQALINSRRAQLVQIEGLKEFVTKFKDKGEKRAAQVQSKLKTLKKLEETLPPIPKGDKPLVFKFPKPEEIKQHLVLFDDVTFSYDKSKPLLTKVNIAIDMDSRIGVIGPNGVGKSTLIKLILGKLEPDSGKIEKAHQLRSTYFSQHHYEQLDLSTSAVEYFLKEFGADLAGKTDRVQMVRRYLGRFGIKGDRQNQKMKLLSGGQKSRVAFAAMTFKSPHLIVLDEPTNHLDVESVDALIAAIALFEGSVLVISHDTHFLSKFAKVFWALTPKSILRFSEFEDAKEHALKSRIGEIEQ